MTIRELVSSLRDYFQQNYTGLLNCYHGVWRGKNHGQTIFCSFASCCFSMIFIVSSVFHRQTCIESQVFQYLQKIMKMESFTLDAFSFFLLCFKFLSDVKKIFYLTFFWIFLRLLSLLNIFISMEGGLFFSYGWLVQHWSNCIWDTFTPKEKQIQHEQKARELFLQL